MATSRTINCILKRSSLRTNIKHISLNYDKHHNNKTRHEQTRSQLIKFRLFQHKSGNNYYKTVIQISLSNYLK